MDFYWNQQITGDLSSLQDLTWLDVEHLPFLDHFPGETLGFHGFSAFVCMFTVG
jgi:hypothetical protein